jgi:hypothetical protein
MTFNATAGALSHLVFGKGGQEAGGGPSLLVRALSEVGPDQLDGGKTEIAEHQAEAGGINGISSAHGAGS